MPSNPEDKPFKFWDFRSRGLIVRSRNYHPKPSDKGPLASVTDGELVGFMHFRPSRTFPKEITSTLLDGVDGFQDFFEEIEQGQAEPPHLYGKSHGRMAKIVRRLGFDAHPIPGKDGEYGIFADTSVVRERLQELLKDPRVDRLRQREERLARRNRRDTNRKE